MKNLDTYAELKHVISPSGLPIEKDEDEDEDKNENEDEQPERQDDDSTSRRHNALLMKS